MRPSLCTACSQYSGFFDHIFSLGFSTICRLPRTARATNPDAAARLVRFRITAEVKTSACGGVYSAMMVGRPRASRSPVVRQTIASTAAARASRPEPSCAHPCQAPRYESSRGTKVSEANPTAMVTFSRAPRGTPPAVMTVSPSPDSVVTGHGVFDA